MSTSRWTTTWRSIPDETVFDDFFDAHVNACIIKGQLLALPNDGAPEGIWYNADLYDAAGLPYPDWDTTWSDMSAAGTALTQVDGSITTHYGIGHPNWLGTIWSNGGEILNEDGTQCLLDSDEAIEALEWMQGLVVDDGSAPGPEALSELGMFDRFTSGSLGSFWCVRGCLGGLRSIEDFQFDAAPLPLSNNGSRLTRLLIGWTSIWSGSEVPDEAYLLAAWICSPKGSACASAEDTLIRPQVPGGAGLVQELRMRTVQQPRGQQCLPRDASPGRGPCLAGASQ